MNQSRVVLSDKGERWVRSGHPWIFRGDIRQMEEPENGAVTPFFDRQDRILGWGFYSRHSRIALRRISFAESPPEQSWWRYKVEEAVGARKSLLDQPEGACRLVFSESDGLPGLIADWYAGHLVLQTLIPGTELLLPALSDFFRERLQPKSILLRNDLEVRRLEQLPPETRLLWGELPEKVAVGEGPIRYWVDLRAGQKTGGYLDQQENRKHLSGYCRPGFEVLDCFSHTGGFALHQGLIAGSVLAVDDSVRATALGKENAALNGLNRIQFLKENAFDFLKKAEKEGRRFDLVILDPPPFARKKSEITGGLRGYLDLNRRALTCLKSGGILATFSCSHNITEPAFLGVLKEAAQRSRRRVFLLEKRLQSPDHPILLTFPESFYLKGLVVRVE